MTLDKKVFDQHIAEGNSFLKDQKDALAEESYAKGLKLVQYKEHASLQALCLKYIGDVYEGRREYVKAIGLYNAALVRSSPWQESSIIAAIQVAEQAFLLFINAKDLRGSEYSQTMKNADHISFLRRQCTDGLQEIDKWWKSEQAQYMGDTRKLILDDNLWRQRSEKIAAIYREFDTQYKIFLSDLINECEQIIGTPPCRFTVISLGSLARGEATPYSDIEFAILIEEEKDSKANVEYFKNLTNLLHIKILNLQETIRPSLAIKSLNDFNSSKPEAKWFFDDITPRRIAFDGAMPSACKIPLGRQEGKNTDFLLIQTPQAMANFISLGWHNKDQNLTRVMLSSGFIYGDQQLLTDYHSKVVLTYKKLNKEFARRSLWDDIEKYDPYLNDPDSSGRPYLVKQEIYRLPTTILEGLSRCYNILDSKSSERILALQKQEILSAQYTGPFCLDKFLYNVRYKIPIF